MQQKNKNNNSAQQYSYDEAYTPAETSLFLLKEGTPAKNGEESEDWDEDIFKEGEEHHQPPLPAQPCFPDQHPNGSRANHDCLWLHLQPH